MGMDKERDRLKRVGVVDRSFLLRCWQESDPAVGEESSPRLHWRFTLTGLGEQPTSRGFAALDELVGFLGELLAGLEAGNEPEDK